MIRLLVSDTELNTQEEEFREAAFKKLIGERGGADVNVDL